MSYYCSVALGMMREDAAAMVAAYMKEFNCDGKIFNFFDYGCECYEYDEEDVIVNYWDEIKWGSEDTEWIEKYLKETDSPYHFISIGEDANDTVEMWQNDDDWIIGNKFRLVRYIEFDI